MVVVVAKASRTRLGHTNLVALYAPLGSGDPRRFDRHPRIDLAHHRQIEGHRPEALPLKATKTYSRDKSVSVWGQLFSAGFPQPHTKNSLHQALFVLLRSYFVRHQGLEPRTR